MVVMIEVCTWGDQNENQSTKSRLRHHPHVSSGKGHQKCIFSKTLFKAEIFENTCFVFSCGWMKMEFFKYNDVTNHILLALHMLCQGCYHVSIDINNTTHVEMLQ